MDRFVLSASVWVLPVLSITPGRAPRTCTKAKWWLFTDSTLNLISLARVTAGSHSIASVGTKSSDHLARHVCGNLKQSSSQMELSAYERTYEADPPSFYLNPALLLPQVQSSSNEGSEEGEWPSATGAFPHRLCRALVLHGSSKANICQRSEVSSSSKLQEDVKSVLYISMLLRFGLEP